MAKTIIKIELTPQTMTQLMNGVKKNGSRAWIGRVFSNAAAIGADIGNMLVHEFNSSAVARALRGQGSEDLPAHFGLSDSTANSLVDGMAELIRTSVRIKGGNIGGIASVRILAVKKDWEIYLSLPGAQYKSMPSNIIIPVAKWLLIDPSIDIGQAAYDIVFSGEDQKFDVRINKVSRSGRAIMVSLAVLGGGGGYVLPSIVSNQAGQNFIEYTLGQPGVAAKAAAILMKRVK
jgi:hypothetical protein